MTDNIPPLGDMSTMMSGLPPLSTPFNESNVDKAAQDFEAMFATQLLQPMFETVDVDPAFGGGHGEEIMRSFLVQEYGKIIAKNGRLGIAAKVKAEMLRAQENARKNGSASNARAAQDAYVAASNGGSHAAN